MPQRGGGKIRNLIRCKTRFAWAKISNDTMPFETPCVTWQAEVKSMGQEQYFLCKCTRSEDPTAGEYCRLWLANSEMPPIVCNPKGVLLFYGGLCKNKNNRPLVTATTWKYAPPILTQRLTDPVVGLYVARAKMFAWGVGVVAPNLPPSILDCECEHVSALHPFTVHQSPTYVIVLYTHVPSRSRLSRT